MGPGTTCFIGPALSSVRPSPCPMPLEHDAAHSYVGAVLVGHWDRQGKMMRGLIRIFWRGGRLALPLLVWSVGAGQAQATWFATECQQEFQNGWAATLPKTWTRCSRFNDEMRQTD